MSLPKLPAKAAYLHLSNPSRRNALSLAVLRDLRAQLHKHTTSPVDGRLRLLPPFRPSTLDQLDSAADSSLSASDSQGEADLSWLVNTSQWRAHRENLPNVLVLRSDGPVFSAGHDLAELSRLPRAEVKETFALCAEVMKLLRRFPGIVVGRVQGLATAAGAQLALSTDIPVAAQGTMFRLPGASIGLPCTSPSTAVCRRVGNALGFRMLATAEPVRVEELNGAVEVVGRGAAEVSDEDKKNMLDERVGKMVENLCNQAGMTTALGKWAFWTQSGLKGGGQLLDSAEGGDVAGGGSGGDGYEEAVEWAGRMMALHARTDDAREGMTAFMEKRKPVWKT